jgi:cell division protein FtsW
VSNLSGNTVYSETRAGGWTLSRTGRGAADVQFSLLALLLLGVGVIMVLSASFARAYYDPSGETGGDPVYYFVRQLFFALGGVGAMLIFSRLPIGFFRRFSFWVLGGSVALLAAVPIIGVSAGGAKRWISLGFTTFQPSEIAKLGVILAFSTMICKYKDKMRTFKYGIAPFIIILAVIVILLGVEPHISAAIIIIALGASMLFIGGAKLYWFVAGGGLVAGLGLFAITLPFLKHASSRISVWLDPLSDTTGDAWQITQSLYAVGSGGLLGLGLGQSRQKYLYLPEEHNDFIFSIICEELGFIGAALILVLFALLIVRGYYLAMHAKDRYSFLVCAGIITLFALQVILNVAVVTNLIPATGISLPFFSYGGTALLIQMAEIGIILSISRDIPAKKQL